MSVAPAVPPAASAEPLARPRGPTRRPRSLRRLAQPHRHAVLVELQKLRHDRTELYTRAVQPALWLLIFGETFTRIHAIPTGGVPYLDYLAPGIIAQSAMFIAIFYGIQIIWERDAGRAHQAAGHADPAGRAGHRQGVRGRREGGDPGGRSWSCSSAHPRRRADLEPAEAARARLAVVVLGSAFFSCLSMTIAGLVLTRDRLMGIGQAITMPLFFGSNALYPEQLMPGWLQAISKANPLSLRGGRAARTADRHPGPPRAGLRRPGQLHDGGRDGRGGAAPPPGALIIFAHPGMDC